jgi:hypothetical protein
MNDQSSFLKQVKEISKQYNIDQVNKMLKSGWRLLSLEQQRDSIDLSMTTYYILGLIEEVEENKE